MSSVQVNLPQDLQSFINGQVELGNYDGVSSYITALVSRAKEGNDQLELLLLEGLESGDAIPLDKREWQKIRQEVVERLSDGIEN